MECTSVPRFSRSSYKSLVYLHDLFTYCQADTRARILAGAIYPLEHFKYAFCMLFIKPDSIVTEADDDIICFRYRVVVL